MPVFQGASGGRRSPADRLIARSALPARSWSFRLQPLDGGHWVSVARGPPAAVVDALGGFRGSLRAPDLAGEALQVGGRAGRAGAAGAPCCPRSKGFGSGAAPRSLQAWLHAPSPSFSLVSVEELLPGGAALELLELRQEVQAG